MDSSFMSQAMQGGDLGSATATMERSAYYYQYSHSHTTLYIMPGSIYEPPIYLS